MAERISFDGSLYPREAVDAAARAYAEFASIEVGEAGDGVQVSLEPAAGFDAKMVTHAFANHVLHEAISLRRQAAADEA